MTRSNEQTAQEPERLHLSGHADMQTVKGYYQAGGVMANPAAHLADREG